jgi:hypothetical protein
MFNRWYNSAKPFFLADTNFVLDVISPGRSRKPIAQALLDRLKAQDYKILYTDTVLGELIKVTHQVSQAPKKLTLTRDIAEKSGFDGRLRPRL